jgi:hypothetical protein
MRTCNSGRVEAIDAVARYEPETDRIELSVRLPETPAYKLDFLQEIRQFGPELLSEAEAITLLEAASAYAVGEYRTAIDLLEGDESLSALTLLAQARLFADDLAGSQRTYNEALQKPQPGEEYTGKLYMGAALAWWRPESYYLLSYQGNRDECLEAGSYYARAERWIQSDRLAQNIRIAYARFCVDPNDPVYAGYAEWIDQTLQSESDLSRKDAAEINAIEQYILARDQQIQQGIRNEGDRTLYKQRLRAAQPLLLSRAALSEFLWEAEDNCKDARTWREDFRSGIVSDIERGQLRKLLQAQPLFCR